jgi:hypothetical protein
MNPLESRKRLLVAESELNRLQLSEEWHAMTDGIRGLADRVKSVSSLASVVALFVAGVAAFRRGKSVEADAKPSWLQTIVNGAGLISSLWQAIRARSR